MDAVTVWRWGWHQRMWHVVVLVAGGLFVLALLGGSASAVWELVRVVRR
jgi:hypothetical protein